MTLSFEQEQQKNVQSCVINAAISFCIASCFAQVMTRAGVDASLVSLLNLTVFSAVFLADPYDAYLKRDWRGTFRLRLGLGLGLGALAQMTAAVALTTTG